MTAPVSIETLPALDVLDQSFHADPQAVLAPLRSRTSLARSARGLEVLSYGACRRVYQEAAFCVGQREAYIATGIADGPVFETFVNNINNVDDDSIHRRLRQAIAPLFTPRRIEEWRLATRELLQSWLAAARGCDQVDFMELVADRLPASLFCSMIGVDLDNHADFARLSRSLTKFFRSDPSYRDEIVAAFDETVAITDELLSHRRNHPGNDLVSDLLRVQDEGLLEPSETVTMLLTFLLASTDSTSGQIALNLIALGNNKEQWHLLRGDPSLHANAATELARYSPGVWATTRTAREPIVFEGVALDAGTRVFSSVISANFDEDVFVGASELDISRRVRQPPLNWGFGRHFCIGRALAGMELEETSAALAEWWVDFEFAAEPEILGRPFVVSPERLQLEVSWAK